MVRALYQRKKGRDLYDLAAALLEFEIDYDKVLYAFNKYMEFVGSKVSGAEFEANLYTKLKDRAFTQDISYLLPKATRATLDYNYYANLVQNKLIVKLPGAAWQGLEQQE